MKDNIINLRKKSEEELKVKINVKKRGNFFDRFSLKKKQKSENNSDFSDIQNQSNKKISKIIDKTIRIIFYFLVFLLPLFVLPFSTEIYEFNKTFLLFIFSTLVFLLWFIKMIFVDKKIKIRKGVFDFLVLFFVFAIMLSTIFSVDKISSILGFYGRFSDSLLVYINLAMLYFVAVNSTLYCHYKDKDQSDSETVCEKLNDEIVLSKTHDDIDNLVKVFFISSVVIIIISLIYSLGFKFITWPEAQFRYFNPTGAFSSSLGLYLVPVIIIALYLQKKTISSIYNRALSIFILFAVILLILIDLIIAWIVLGVSLILLLLFLKINKEKTKIVSFSIIVVIFISAIFTLSSLSFFNSTSDKNFQSSSISLFLNNSLFNKEEYLNKEIVLDKKTATFIAVESFKSRPILGSGIGTYMYNFSKFKPAEFNNSTFWNLRFDKAGSEMLEKISTIGVLGMLSYSLILLFVILTFLKIAKRSKSLAPFFIFSSWLSLLLFQFLYLENTTTKFLFWLFSIIIILQYNSLFGKKDYIILDLKKKQIVYYLSFVVLISISFLIVLSGYYQFKFYKAEMAFKNVKVVQSKMSLTNKQDIQNILSQNINKINKEVINVNPYRGEYKMYLSGLHLNYATILFREENMKSKNEINPDKVIEQANFAINNIRYATEANPSSVVFQHRFGATYVAIGSDFGIPQAMKNAIEKYQSAIDSEPTNFILHNELGKIYLLTGDSNLAEEEFKKVLSLKKNYPDANLELAKIYQKAGQKDMVLEQINKAIVSGQVSKEDAFKIGMIYYNIKENELAKEIFLKLTEYSPNNSNFHYMLGFIYEREENYSKALEEFEKTLSLNLDNSSNLEVAEKIKSLKKIIKGNETQKGDVEG